VRASNPAAVAAGRRQTDAPDLMRPARGVELCQRRSEQPGPEPSAGFPSVGRPGQPPATPTNLVQPGHRRASCRRKPVVSLGRWGSSRESWARERQWPLPTRLAKSPIMHIMSSSPDPDARGPFLRSRPTPPCLVSAMAAATPKTVAVGAGLVTASHHPRRSRSGRACRRPRSSVDRYAVLEPSSALHCAAAKDG
jgi:hypothetical protein